MPPLPALAALLPGIPLTPPPPLPAPAPRPALQRRAAPASQARLEGTSIRINGLRQQALWLQDAGELWLPLEVLEGQLGVSHRPGANGSVDLEWFGQKLSVSADRQRSLEDEVAVPVSSLLETVGVISRTEGQELNLQLLPRPLQAIRWSNQGVSGQRVVLDLSGPALVRSGEGRLLIGTEASPQQLEQLKQLGLSPSQRNGWLSVPIPRDGERLSLGGPWRLVLAAMACRA
jgi:hypothetical protein